jgi:hypothetical protein
MSMSHGEITLTGSEKKEEFGEKRIPVPLCQPQIPQRNSISGYARVLCQPWRLFSGRNIAIGKIVISFVETGVGGIASFALSGLSY